MRRIGPKTKKWLSTRRAWLKNNPPNHEGYYECYICDRWIPKTLIQLDHVKSRSRHPELIFEQTNLRPICGKCNALKGSKDLEEL